MELAPVAAVELASQVHVVRVQSTAAPYREGGDQLEKVERPRGTEERVEISGGNWLRGQNSLGVSRGAGYLTLVL